MTSLFLTRVASLTAAVGLASTSLFGMAGTAIAQAFGQKEMDQSQLVLLASPFGSGSFQLLILEQVSAKRQCWTASGTNPTLVDPLLATFDFTGVCGRSTDSNGYSLRMAERDYGLIYQLKVAQRDNDLVLLGVNQTDSKAPPIVLGQTGGLPPSGGFAQINLNPGWRLTKRTTNGKVMGHVYLTSDTVPAGAPKPSAFRDTQAHWATAYIDALAAKGIISGFSEDGTFRPDEPVTRVQFAAIANKAFANARSQRTAATFKDVAATFWGLQAIQSAYQKGFMTGYPDNTFKPNQAIPRMEVLVSLSSGLGLPKVDPSVLKVYQDADQLPGWATDAVAAATDKQVVVNYPKLNLLNPNREATRAEVAAFVYQSLVATGQVQALPSPYVVVATP